MTFLRTALTSIFRRRIRHIAVCALLGHRASDPNLNGTRPPFKRCDCGIRILREDDSETRIRHVAGCFLSGHNYEKVGERNGRYEYLCRQCGHLLLIEVENAADAQMTSLHKKPRYLCNLFGHRVRKVIERNGFTEYDCRCGHPFLKTKNDMVEVKHPIICLIAGHFVRFLTHRAGHAEYLCRNCGHTFLFPTLSIRP